MKHINEYIDESLHFYQLDKQINESVTNLWDFHSVEVSSIFRKLNTYNTNSLRNTVDESSDDYTFTLDEQEVIKEMLTIACNKYMLQEQFNEGIKDTLTTLWNSGKEKIEQGIEAAHIKIKQVNAFLEDIKNKAITTVKELVDKFVDLLSVLKCNIAKLFEVIGFDTKNLVDDFNNDIDEYVKDDRIMKLNIYEEHEKKERNGHVVDSGKLIWKNFKDVFKSMAIATLLTYLVPVVVTVIGTSIGGPIVGKFAGTIAKSISVAYLTGNSVYKFIKAERKFHKDPNGYAKLPTWGKVLHVIIFLFMLGWTAWSTSQGIGTIKDLLSASTISFVPHDAFVDVIIEIIDVIKSKGGEAAISVIKSIFIKEGENTLTKLGQKFAVNILKSHDAQENIIGLIEDALHFEFNIQ